MNRKRDISKKFVQNNIRLFSRMEHGHARDAVAFLWSVLRSAEAERENVFGDAPIIQRVNSSMMAKICDKHM